MTTQNDVTLYSMVICPFAQRTRIHLELKGVEFELVNLDICRPRPEEFLALNPSGQVPVLVNGDDVVSDSSIVSEYVEDAFPAPLPFGRTPVERAKVRTLVNYIDRSFIPALYILMASSTPEERAERIEKSLLTWQWINNFLEKSGYDGNYVGERFGLAEVSVAPFFLRYEVVSYYQDFEVPDLPDYQLVRQWRDRLLADPVVQSTAESVSDLIKMYEDYTIGYFNGAVPPGRERSSSDLSVPLAQRNLPPKAASVR